MNKEKKDVDDGTGHATHDPILRLLPGRSNREIIQDSASDELENLLRTHPNLAELQDEIERLLRNSGAFENRMAVLGLMIEAKLQELQNRLSHLISTD